MRVISGLYKSRKLVGYNNEKTRPTMDRVKESMFAMINSYIEGSICLDLFCGSGSLGIEALSNGAVLCYFNDCAKDILVKLKDNILNLGIKNCQITNLDYMEALRKLNSQGVELDIIFIDSPYAMNIIDNILRYIYDHHMLKQNGIIVYEHANYTISNQKFTIIKEKKYKDIIVSIIKKDLI